MKATKRVALTIDGSEDGCRDPISNVMAILPDCSALLLKQIAHTTEVHSTENILREINTCTAELAAIGVSVRGVTSDNLLKSRFLVKPFFCDRVFGTISTSCSFTRR